VIVDASNSELNILINLTTTAQGLL
jgi:hypothetical protein